MTYTESWLTGPKDCQIYTRTYKADNAKAILVFVHGFDEHIGRYEHVHNGFQTGGITVFCFDQRGFGKTALDEKRSKDSTYGKTNWNDQAADIEWAVKHARNEFGDLPTFLMGHSMGGGLALAFPTREHAPPEKTTVDMLSGVIASSPFIVLTHAPNMISRWIGVKASALFPYKTIPAAVKSEHLSHDPDVNEAYLKDPLIKPLGTLRGVADMLSGGEGLLRRDFRRWPPSLPVYLYHGDKDEVTSHKATEEVFNKLPAREKKLKLYPGGYHELHNEPDGVKEAVVEECISFIDSHLERHPEPEAAAKL